MNRYLYISASLLLCTVGLNAQAQIQQQQDTTMNRVMVIEHEYTPEIMDAVKINILPAVEAPVVVKKEVEYAIVAQPTNNIPAETMQPFIAKEKQPKPKMGFVRLGAGNYGNVDVLANYLWLISPKDKLDAYFQLDGMRGDLTNPYEESEKWKSHYYRTRASLKYQHQFSKVDLNVGAQFGLSNFNLLPATEEYVSQKFTSGDVHFGVKSTDEDMLLQFDLETNYMIYQRKANLFNDGRMTENRIKTKANVWGAIDEDQAVGVEMNMNNFIYNGYGLKDYTTVDLKPYYRFVSDYWRLKVGANVDLSLGQGSKLRVSPDVNVEYVFADSYVAYIKATGGRLLNDFRRLEEYDPYGRLQSQEANTYEQVNASVGVKGSPISGLWFQVYGGYQNLKDELYCNFMNDEFALPTQNIMLPIAYYTTNMNNGYGGISLSYAYKQIFQVSTDAIYRHWKSDENELALIYKPQLEFNFNVDFTPLDNVLINVGYQYAQRSKVEEHDYRAKAVNNLNVGASYELIKGLSVYARLYNILGSNYQWYFKCPTKKFNLLIGASYKF